MDKTTSAHEIYLQLRAMILNLDIRPGSRLTEIQLAEYFDVSRTPIRAALQRLENEKQIVIRPKQGCYVRDLDIVRISHYYDVRVNLEIMTLQSLAEYGDKKMLAELAEEWDPLKQSFGAEITDELKHAEEDFHLQLAEATNNFPLRDYLADLNDHIRVVRRFGWPNQKSVIDTYTEHHMILQFLLDDKLDKAIEEMTMHIRKSQDQANRVTLHQLYRNKNMIQFG
jgi:DNA-binding GntR family transcriptional regulator